MRDPAGQPAPARVAVSDASPCATVDLAWFTLDQPGHALDGYVGMLDPVELARAERFKGPLHRARYLAARGQLRILLAQRLGCYPASVRLAVGLHGKPVLAVPAGGDPPLHFNLAHSGGRAVVALARHPVGVDLEQVAPFTGMTALAGQFFSPAERRVLQALPPERTADGFFAVWTRKEAVLKAVGAGLALPLDGFDVEADPDAPASLCSARLPALDGPWWLADLKAGDGWRACLAIPSTAA